MVWPGPGGGGLSAHSQISIEASILEGKDQEERGESGYIFFFETVKRGETLEKRVGSFGACHT